MCLLFISVLTVDYLDVSNPERATFPRFREIQEAYPKELGSSVRFPQFNIGTQGNKGGNDASIRPRLNFFSAFKASSSFFLTSAEPTPAPPAQTEAVLEEEHTVSDRKRRHLEPPAPLPVAVVIVYKSLGKLLPERYDADRRSLR